MKTKSLIRPFIAFIILSAVVISCSKNDKNDQAQAQQEEYALASTESDAEAEIISNDVFDNVLGVNAEVGIGGTGVFAGSKPNEDGSIYGPMGVDSVGRCFTVAAESLDSGSTFPIKVTIDFGEGCTGRDGRIRKGKIITEYSDRLIFPGATAMTSFDGYSVNGIAIEGSHLITNTSNSNGLAFKINIDGKLSRDNGDFVYLASEKNISQSAGTSTPFDIRDDAYSITGSANGTTKRGDKTFAWQTEIISPLVKKFGCRWIVQGKISHQKDGVKIAEFDYGSGTCDNQATLDVNGQTRIITLY